MQKFDFKPLILKILYSFAGAIVCLQVIHMDRAVSFCFYATFYLTLIFWITCALQRMERLEFWMLAGILIAFVSVLINAALSSSVITMQYLKKLLSFFSTILFFSAAYKSVPNASVRRWIYGILDLVSAYLIVAYFYQGQRAYLFHGVVSNYLTFGFTNPNLTGLFLAGMIMLEMNRLPALTRSWQRIPAWAEVCFLLFFLWKTKARNALLSVILFLVIFFVLSLRKADQPHFGKTFSKIAAVWPLLFAGAYILFLQLPGVIRLFSFLESAGKDLTSRMEIWLRALRLWLSSPIFGAYAQASGGSGSSQFHNTHIDILVSYGPIVLCIVCFALYSLIYMSGKRQSRQQFLFTIGFTCEIILGVGEAAIFSGGLGVYLYAGTFLLLRNLCQPEAGMEAAP